MLDENTFDQFICRIRAGDEQAAVELVRKYEPLIRREVRMRLEDRRLGQVLDSIDVCQSVLASFFVRTAAGQYDLEKPDQLLRLLVTMVRNKLASAARSHHRQRRDRRRLVPLGREQLANVADVGPSPSQLLAGKELLERVRQSLSAEERQIADLRTEGLAWADISARLGGTAQARRMQLSRAVDRVVRELGLEEEVRG
jgi:RNA polymerase sigma-70 factor (ECF subfamily)